MFKWSVLLAVGLGFISAGCGSEEDGRLGESSELSPAGSQTPKGSVIVTESRSDSGSRTDDHFGVIRNVVIVSIDTLRADRLGVYGNSRLLSPNIDSVASRAAVFDHAYAQASQTAPSHASLFTSSYPGTHGIVNVHGDHAAFPTLPAGIQTVAEVLDSMGLQTAAFVSGGNMTRHMNMHRGFRVWSERNDGAVLRVEAFLNWLADNADDRFFAFIHTYDVHAPYVPPRALAARFTDSRYVGPLRARYERYVDLTPDEAWRGGVGEDYWEGMLDYTPEDVRFLSDLYDGEVCSVDGALRRLFEALLVGPRAADTVLILLSDHGEEFREHGKFQHDQVFEELIHVPLIVKLPGQLESGGWKGRVSVPVQLIDVAPTVAELLGCSTIPDLWRGRSLVPLLKGTSRGTISKGWAEPTYCELTISTGPKVYRSVTHAGWKYIHIYQRDLDVTWEHLYDLSNDPGERNNVINSDGDLVIDRRDKLRELLALRSMSDQRDRSLAGESGWHEMDDESRMQLEALGYVGSGER